MINYTIDDIFRQWIELKRPLITKQTYRSYTGFYTNHIFPRIGVRVINTLHFIDYQKLANDMLDDGKKPKTVKNVFGVLSGIYDFAKKNEWYDGIPFPNLVELPKFDNKFYVTINPELQRKYLKAIMSFHEPVYKDIFVFLLHGRRLNEVLDLKWEYLDMSEKIMYLPSSHNKSRKNLSFMLTDRMIDALSYHYKDAIERQDTPFVKGHVFLNPITLKRYANITKAWKRLLTRAELPYMKLHAIRHLVGTYLINELGLPIQEVSVMLGHSDIKITQRYYNPKPEIARDCTATLFDDLKGKGEKYIDELDETIKLGELVKKGILSLKEPIKVGK